MSTKTKTPHTPKVHYDFAEERIKDGKITLAPAELDEAYRRHDNPTEFSFFKFTADGKLHCKESDDCLLTYDIRRQDITYVVRGTLLKGIISVDLFFIVRGYPMEAKK